MRTLVVWITGDPVAPVQEKFGGFDSLYARALSGIEAIEVRGEDVRKGTIAPLPEAASVLISGSPASVTEIEQHPWMQVLASRIVTEVARGTPMLGVCFGHQMMAHALGGRVTRNPAGFHMCSTRIEQVECEPPFQSLAAQSPINVSHEDYVHIVPPQARVMARAAHDPHHALAYGGSVFSTQFHPEFDDEVLRLYQAYRRPKLEQAGWNVDTLLEQTRDAPAAREVLRNWVRDFAC